MRTCVAPARTHTIDDVDGFLARARKVVASPGPGSSPGPSYSPGPGTSASTAAVTASPADDVRLEETTTTTTTTNTTYLTVQDTPKLCLHTEK